METDRDNFEYALSQYADGTLNELEQRVLEDRLRSDAEARLLVSDFIRVDALLRNSRELPEIDFDAFAVNISQAIEAEDAPVASPLRINFFRWTGAAAIAAAVAVAAFVGLRLQNPATAPPAVATGTAVISGPSIEVARVTPDIHIGVGPSDALAKRGDSLSLGEKYK